MPKELQIKLGPHLSSCMDIKDMNNSFCIQCVSNMKLPWQALHAHGCPSSQRKVQWYRPCGGRSPRIVMSGEVTRNYRYFHNNLKLSIFKIPHGNHLWQGFEEGCESVFVRSIHRGNFHLAGVNRRDFLLCLFKPGL